MATVTSLGFNVFSRYDGTGIRRARADLARLSTQERIMTENAARMTRAVALFGPVAIPAFAGAAAAAAKASVSFGAAAAGVGLWALAMRNFIKTNKGAQAQVERLKGAVNRFGLSASAILGKTLTTAVSAAVAAFKAMEPVVRAVSPAILKIAQDVNKFANGPGMKKFSSWLQVAAPAAIAALWQATKNLASGLLTLGQRLGLFNDKGRAFNVWIVKVTESFKRWANGPEIPRLRAFLAEAGPAVGELAIAFLKLAKAVIVALGPMALLVVKALIPLVNWLARMAEEHPRVVQAIWAMIAANRVLNVVLAIYRSAIIQALIHLIQFASGVLMTTARLVAQRVALLASAAATRIHAAASAVAAGAQRLLAAASLLLTASFWRQVAATVAAGVAHAAMAARMAAARVAIFATFVATNLLSAAMWRAVAATLAQTAAGAAMAARMAIIRVATLAWAAAQWALNIALLANPYVLIAAAIIALVVAIVLAYQRSETFRNIVNAAFRAVGTVAMWLFDNVLRPAFTWYVAYLQFLWGVARAIWGAMMTVFRAVGAAALWMWQNAIMPAFRGIATLASWLWTSIRFTFALIVAIFRALGQVAVWLWQNAIMPAFRGIGALAQWLWNNAIRPTFTFMVNLWRNTVGAAAIWLWQVAIGPAFRAIGDAAQWLWNVAIRPSFTFIGNIFQLVGQGAMWLWNNAIGPAFRGIATAARVLWLAIQVSFNAINGFYQMLGRAATALMNGTVTVFDIIRAAANALWQAIQTAFNAIANVFRSTASIASGIWTAMWNGIRAVFNAAWSAIRTTFAAFTSFISSAFSTVASVGTSLWQGMWNTIRSIFNAAWAAIRGTFNVIRGWISSAFSAISTFATNTWGAMWNRIRQVMNAAWSAIRGTFNVLRSWISSAFDAISEFATNMWGAMWSRIRQLLNQAWSAIRGTMSTIRSWLASAWDAISEFATNMWGAMWARIRQLLNQAWSAIRTTMSTLRSWLASAWDAISEFATNMWGAMWARIRQLLNIAWTAIRGTFTVMRNWMASAWDAISEFATNMWGAMWNRIRQVLNSAWSAIRTTFNTLRDTIIGIFQSTVNGVQRIWNTLRGIVAKPVNFVIGVYNDHLYGLADKVLGAIGVDNPLKKVAKIPGFAKGGVVDGYAAGGVLPGYSPGRDNMLARGPRGLIGLSGGEGILRPEVMRTPGMTSFLNTANQAAIHGGQSGVRNLLDARMEALPKPKPMKYPYDPNRPNGYAKGGVVGGIPVAENHDIGDIIGSAVRAARTLIPGVNSFITGFDMTKDAIWEMGWETILSKAMPWLSKLWDWLPEHWHFGGELAGGVGQHVIQAVTSFVGQKAAPPMMGSLAGLSWGQVSARLKKGLAWAKSQDNKPYQLGGNGNPSWDCSSFLSAIQRVIMGQSPGRMWTTHPFHSGRKSYAGWERDLVSPFMMGITPAGIGHTAGTLIGTNVESSGSYGVQAPAPRGADHPMFKYQYGLKAVTKDAVLKSSGGSMKGAIPPAQRRSILMAAMSAAGVSGGNWMSGLMTLVQRESSWRPGLTNNWDSNARAGIASRGLAQVIPPTFAQFHVPGMNDIMNPVHNIAAAIRYIISRYGGIGNVQQANPNLPPRGYARGGHMSAGEMALVGERGPEVFRAGGAGGEVYSSGTKVTSHGDTHVHFHDKVYVKSEREFQKMVVTAIEEARRKKKI